MAYNKLVLTSWSYSEGLIQAAVIPYLKMIADAQPSAQLYLVTEEKDLHVLNAGDKQHIKYTLSALNTSWIPQQYHHFGIKKIFFSFFQFIKLVFLIFSKKINYIHAFCTPAGATGYLLSLITGCRLIIDSYEPHAESMVENGTWTKNSKAFKILWALEKKQSRRAHWCIGIASGMKQYALSKWNVRLKNFSLRPMCVDLKKFEFSEEQRKDIRHQLGWQHKMVAVYAGKFGGIYYDKEVFDFLEEAWKYFGTEFRILILSSQSKNDIERLYDNTKIPRGIVYIKTVNYQDMPGWLSVADFALTPVKPVPSKKYCSPIKDGEYWAIGLPVVISKNISDDSGIIKEAGIGSVIDYTNTDDYLVAIKQIEKLLQSPEYTRRKIRDVADKYRNFKNAAIIYNEIYA